MTYALDKSGLLLPMEGPSDPHPPTIRIPIRGGVCFPDGAILIHADLIGKSEEFAEEKYRGTNQRLMFFDADESKVSA